MTPRTWYLGVAAIVLALVLHAAIPRYEWRSSEEYTNILIRIDRWTGRAETGVVRHDWGRWVSDAEYRQFVARR